MKHIFIDLGACTGESITLFKKSYPNSDDFFIHSFEAFPSNFQSLEASYGNVGTIKLYNVAAHTESTRVKFHHGSKYSSSLRPDKLSGGISKDKFIEIDAIDIAQFIIDNFSKDDYIVLKMDIEGSEYDILPHLLDTGVLQEYVNELYGEWHWRKIGGISEESHNRLVSRLDKAGFKMGHWCALIGRIDR